MSPNDLVSNGCQFRGSCRVLNHNLEEVGFCLNLRSARRGAAGGPSGMTVEHLQAPASGFQSVLPSWREVVQGVSSIRHSFGTDDSPREARHCCWRHREAVGGPHDVPADDGGGQISHRTVLMCNVNKRWL